MPKHTHTHTHTHTRTHTHRGRQAHMDTHTQAHTHTHRQAHTHTHTHRQAHMDTHTQAHSHHTAQQFHFGAHTERSKSRDSEELFTQLCSQAHCSQQPGGRSNQGPVGGWTNPTCYSSTDARLFSLRRKGDSDTCYAMGEPGAHEGGRVEQARHSRTNATQTHSEEVPRLANA